MTVYDLEAEEEARLERAEERQHRAAIERELAAIREALQAMDALLVGMLLRNGKS